MPARPCATAMDTVRRIVWRIGALLVALPWAVCEWIALA